MGLLDDAIREHLDLKRRSGGDPTEIEKAERDALGPVRRGPISVDEPPAAEMAAPAAPRPAFDDEPDPLDDPFGAAEHEEPAARTEVPQADPPSTGGRGFFRRRSAPPPEPEPLSEPEPRAHSPRSPGPPSLQIPGRRTDDELDPWDEDELEGPPSEEYMVEPSPEVSAAPAARPPAPEPPALQPQAATPHPAQPVSADPPRPAQAAQPAPAAPTDPPTTPSQPPPGDDLLGETVEYDVERAFQESGEADEDVLEETPEFLQDTPDHDRLWFEQRPPKDFDFDG
jgi:hypothetical protein